MVKPDAFTHRTAILNNLTIKGLSVATHKVCVPSRTQVLDHYNKDDEWCIKNGLRVLGISYANVEDGDNRARALHVGRNVILERIVQYMTSGEVCIAIVRGDNALERVYGLTGSTEPCNAKVGTIREHWRTVPQLPVVDTCNTVEYTKGFIFVKDSYALADVQRRAVWNVVHSSDSIAEAKREASIWFGLQEAKKHFE